MTPNCEGAHEPGLTASIVVLYSSNGVLRPRKNNLVNYELARKMRKRCGSGVITSHCVDTKSDLSSEAGRVIIAGIHSRSV